MDNRIEKKIFLKTLDDVKAFVNIAMSKEYDIEMLGGKYIVNAKSIMGVLSLDLTQPLIRVCTESREIGSRRSGRGKLSEKRKNSIAGNVG